MMTDTKTTINSIEDLQLERARLRGKIYRMEVDLKVHYSEISEKVKSVTRVFGVVSRVKNMIGIGDGDKENKSDEPRSYLNTAVKVAVPLVAGGLIVTRGKSMILKSLVGYSLGQLTKYIVSKNVNEHVASVKGMFSPKKEKHDEESGIF